MTASVNAIAPSHRAVGLGDTSSLSYAPGGPAKTLQFSRPVDLLDLDIQLATLLGQRVIVLAELVSIDQ